MIFYLLIGSLKLLMPLDHTYTGNDIYYDMPKFWTNTGFCPAGNINHKDITNTLFSDAIQMNLRLIANLPNGALTHIRIHWLLELIKFEQFTQAGVPIYDFSALDDFLIILDEHGIYPVLEFMANPGDVFIKNPTRNSFFFEDFTYQIVKHYLNMFGAAKVMRWRFESWNEPDIHNYNRLNFDINDYLIYLHAVKIGLKRASNRPKHDLLFQLRGPAGLFKSTQQHPLCWGILNHCNKMINDCPINILTYHRKGNGTSIDILNTSTELLNNIFNEYPALENMPISNTESDPISGWSQPHEFNEDIRYAVILLAIIFKHWQAKLQQNLFKNLDTISHDNAFLSYHPYEFSQRTLLAHFRMNNTEPIYSQFIPKPVYSALGIMGKLGPIATNIQMIDNMNLTKVQILKTTVPNNEPLYLNWIILPIAETEMIVLNLTIDEKLPFKLCEKETYAFIVEILARELTDPVHIWRNFNSPSYPNATIRYEMRKKSMPIIYSTGLLNVDTFKLEIQNFKTPYIIQYRICSNLIPQIKPAFNLNVNEVTSGEVLITWHEIINSTRCLKNYEIWFLQSNYTEMNAWQFITKDLHLPFPSYQFAPTNGIVNGFYKVRGIDIFNVKSGWSKSVEYIEL